MLGLKDDRNTDGPCARLLADRCVSSLFLVSLLAAFFVRAQLIFMLNDRLLLVLRVLCAPLGSNSTNEPMM